MVSGERTHWVKDPLYYRGLAGSVALMVVFALIAVAITDGWPYSLIFIPLYMLVGAGIATWPWVAKFGWRDDKL